MTEICVMLLLVMLLVETVTGWIMTLTIVHGRVCFRGVMRVQRWWGVGGHEGDAALVRPLGWKLSFNAVGPAGARVEGAAAG